MIASLPMYLRPETRDAHDRYWQAISDNLRALGVEAPRALTAGGETPDHWRASDLVLSQTCGRPYRLHLHGHVTLVGTPDYGLPDCDAGYYRSLFIARADDRRTVPADFATAVFAYNDRMSQSGWAAPQYHAAQTGFQFENLLQTHGHVTSAHAVAENRADIAAIDGVTWELIKRYDGFYKNLRVIATTTPTPGLPYVCAQSVDRAKLVGAIRTAIKNLTPPDRETLMLRSLVQIPAHAYLAVPNP